jgi:hypothetical protein
MMRKMSFAFHIKMYPKKSVYTCLAMNEKKEMIRKWKCQLP